jgi:hypothetical protein
MRAEAKCSAQITGWLAVARTLASVLSSPSPVVPNRRNELPMAALQLAPVYDLAMRHAAGHEPGLMEAEAELDNIGDAVVVDAFAALVVESLDLAAGRYEPRLEVLGADDAKMLGGDRLAVPLHRAQELGNARPVDLIDAEEGGQRLM